MAMNLLLASRTDQENMILRRKLEPLINEFDGLKFVDVHHQEVTSIYNRETVAIVYNFNDWSRKESLRLFALRKAGYHGKILIIARAPAEKAMRSLNAFENVLFLEKPFEAKEATGIVRKMLKSSNLSQQLYRRYATDQGAEIEFEVRPERFTGRVTNLSRGGAFVEVKGLPRVTIGDHLKVRVALDEVRRVYTLPARVVWTSRGQVEGSVGIEFVGPAAVERTMLFR